MCEKVIILRRQFMSILRTLARGVAHKNMEKDSIKHVNQHDYAGPMYMRSRIDSFFAKNWRDYVTTDGNRTKRRATR